MKAPNHGIKTVVFDSNTYAMWEGYPVYCPQFFGRGVAGHILSPHAESPVVVIFTTDTVRRMP